MSIYCALHAATEVPRENLTIATDDNSRKHDSHLQVMRRWNMEEMNHSVNEFRCSIIASIRMLMWELLTEKGVKSIFSSTPGLWMRSDLG